MHYKYLVNPKNPNIHSFVISYYDAFTDGNLVSETQVEKVRKLNIRSVLDILNKIRKLRVEDKISVMFFATQPEYVPILGLLKLIASVLSKNLYLLHLMHEPRYEQGRTSKLTSFLVYSLNWSIAKLSDRVIVPSSEGIKKAQTFIESSKLCQINLTFKANKEQDLLKYLQDLKFRWDSEKTFSLIGIAAPDRNPHGFIQLAHQINERYPYSAKFIRAGQDKNVIVDYQSEGIITFPGYITNEAKSYLTSLSHFVVIPYLFSTNSAVIPESLSYGKLLIVNDIPVFSYLKNQSFAFVIDFSDRIQMLECINKIFSLTVEEYESSSLAAIDFFKNQHSQSYLTNKLNQVTEI
jgi:hypothetical protein